MKKTIIAIAIIAGVVSTISWSIKHDKETEASAEKYEECVRTEMHTTVMEYYDQHGEYPECK